MELERLREYLESLRFSRKAHGVLAQPYLLFSHFFLYSFVKMLAGKLEPDPGAPKPPQMNVSLKPQTIAPKFQGTVRMLLIKQIKAAFMHPQFQTDVVKPMQLDNIIDQDVQTLSGGELQRVALVLALGKPADIYLIDEPSAYLE